MNADDRGNVAAFRCSLPVGADKMDPFDQLVAMVAGIPEVELTDRTDPRADELPPDLLDRVVAIFREADAPDVTVPELATAAPRNDEPLRCYVDPVRLARIRRGLRNETSPPEEFDQALAELVTDWRSVAIEELLVSYSVHNTQLGAPYDEERRRDIGEAVAVLGPLAVDGILRALTIEERPSRLIAAIQLSPMVAVDPSVPDALAKLADHTPPPIGAYAREALRQIESQMGTGTRGLGPA